MEASHQVPAERDQHFLWLCLAAFAMVLGDWLIADDIPGRLGIRVAVLGVLCALPLLTKAVARRGVLIDAGSVFCVTYFINYGASAIWHRTHVIAEVDMMQALPGALDLAIVGLICYLVGYSMPVGAALSRRLPVPWRDATVSDVQLFSLACIALAALHRLAGALSVGWFVTFLGSFDWIALGLITILAYGPQPPSRGIGSRKWHALLLVAFAVTQGFVTGFRGLFILPVIVFFLSLHFARGRFPWSWFSAFVLAAFLVLLPIASYYKLARQGNEWSIADSIAYTASEAASSGLNAISQDTTEELLLRYGIAPMFTVITEKSGYEVPYQHGATYENMLVSFIPRFLWPDKPILADYAVNELPRAFGMIGEEDERTAAGFGFMGEAYVNFGIAGLLIIMLLFGTFSRMLNDWLLARPGMTPVDGAVFLPVFWVIANQESTLVVGLTGLLKFLAIFVVLGAAMKRRGGGAGTQ